MVVTMLAGHPGPLVRLRTLWEVGLWALGLVSLGWLAFALVRATRHAWPAFTMPVVLLGVARFVGNSSPYLPAAQWVAGLHRLPGTLSRRAGAAYLVGWAIVWGAVALWRAKPSLSEHL